MKTNRISNQNRVGSKEVDGSELREVIVEERSPRLRRSEILMPNFISAKIVCQVR